MKIIKNPMLYNIFGSFLFIFDISLLSAFRNISDAQFETSIKAKELKAKNKKKKKEKKFFIYSIV